MMNKSRDFYTKRIQSFFVLLFAVASFIGIAGCDRKNDEILLMSLENQNSDIAESSGILSDVEEQNPDEESPEEAATDGDEPEVVYVHICGAVNNPGVYELPVGSRVYQAVEMAGGLQEDAATEYVNLADTVMDGEQIIIPTEDETAGQTLFLQKNSSAVSKDNGLININSADADELCELPGIGSARAQAIINYRNSIGGFSTIEQIMEVEGIKSGMYSKIQDRICVK